ncbi:uncharacterized protein SEPMUDRAFT_55107, partial [Sphaerulina musiva SO2202]
QKTFNGSFFHETKFRAKPSPEVDHVWDSLGINYRSILIPPHLAPNLGLRHREHVHAKRKYGGGYVANLEGLHHLHCLNLLRQALYWNFPYYHNRGEGAFRNDEGIVERHVTHCLDILRQQLQCTIDVGVMGQIWYQPSTTSPSPGGQQQQQQKKPQPFVDFNTKHTCRNFEEIRQWAFTHQIQEPTPQDFLEPPGAEDTIYQNIP